MITLPEYSQAVAAIVIYDVCSGGDQLFNKDLPLIRKAINQPLVATL
jgi:hypothetical protein